MASCSWRSALSRRRIRITWRMILVSKPLPLGLGIDFADIGGERGLFLFQPLDALDQRFQLPCREAGFRHRS